MNFDAAPTRVEPKRESDGRYTHSGRLDRMCVCGHSFGDHSCGSPADCLAYSLPEATEADKQCRCRKFKPVRIRGK